MVAYSNQYNISIIVIVIIVIDFKPISDQLPLSITPENNRKPLVFFCFRGLFKGGTGLKWSKGERNTSYPGKNENEYTEIITLNYLNYCTYE